MKDCTVGNGFTVVKEGTFTTYTCVCIFILGYNHAVSMFLSHAIICNYYFYYTVYWEIFCKVYI